MDRCDAIIVNYNARGFLADAVETLLRSQSVEHVYVIDNASTDCSLTLLPQRRDDRLTIIRNAVNLGFAAACNLGFARTTCENILLLNPDCHVVNGAIDLLITALRSSDRVGMAGPLLLNPDGSEQAGGRRRFPTPRLILLQAAKRAGLRWLLPLQPPNVVLHQDPLPVRATDVEAISGACMMVRREAMVDIGPLDEGYFLHVEDLDWCMRAHRAGWRVLFVPDAKVVHHKGVSGRDHPFAVEYYKHRGMIRFYRRWLGERHGRWSLALVTLGIWIRFGAIATLRLVYESIRFALRLVSRERKAERGKIAAKADFYTNPEQEALKRIACIEEVASFDLENSRR